MSFPISAITPASLPDISSTASTQNKPGVFRQVLENAIDRVELSRAAADQKVEQFLSGDADELHSTILATQRADLEFDMFMQVRNKVVSAYQEIMRMQI